MSTPSVILYGYKESPFAAKVENILTLKGIPYSKVDVSRILPRPELSDFLGVSYRRIPVLAIGNDVYCDTSLIAAALEKRFKPEDGYATLFPSTNNGEQPGSGLQKAFTTFYSDRALFSLATAVLPWGMLPKAFIEDRSALRGTQIDVKAAAAQQPAALSNLSLHLQLIEEQLADDREWLLNTTSPSLTDISVQFVLAWIQPFPGISALLKDFPKTVAWVSRLNDLLKGKEQTSSKPKTVTGTEGAQIITASSRVGLSEQLDSLEASRLHITKGDLVTITPDDYGRSHPTKGKLLSLTREEAVIEAQGTMGTVAIHFPRLGYVVNPVSSKL